MFLLPAPSLGAQRATGSASGLGAAGLCALDAAGAHQGGLGGGRAWAGQDLEGQGWERQPPALALEPELICLVPCDWCVAGAVYRVLPLTHVGTRGGGVCVDAPFCR